MRPDSPEKLSCLTFSIRTPSECLAPCRKMGGGVLSYDRVSMVDIINDETGSSLADSFSFRRYSVKSQYLIERGHASAHVCRAERKIP